MTVYFSVLALIAILLFFSYILKENKIKCNLYYLSAFILIFVSGFRYMVGTDYNQYMKNYPLYVDKEITFLSQPAITIAAKISHLIRDDYSTWFFIMSFITIFPCIYKIIKLNKNTELCILFYIILCCWHTSFNLVKQSAAAAILFCGFSFLRDRKLVGWIVTCLFAMLFHISAVLMIPVYFLIDNKISKKKLIMIIIVGIIVFYSYDMFFEIIELLKQDKGMVSDHSSTKNNSVNILRIAVNCMPVLMYYFLADRNIELDNDKDFSCVFNMSFFNAAINIASMGSIYLNRICCFTNIFNIFFIPMLFSRIKKEYTFIKPFCIILYTIFWAYDLYKCSDTINFHWIFER